MHKQGYIGIQLNADILKSEAAYFINLAKAWICCIHLAIDKVWKEENQRS